MILTEVKLHEFTKGNIGTINLEYLVMQQFSSLTFTTYKQGPIQ